MPAVRCAAAVLAAALLAAACGGEQAAAPATTAAPSFPAAAEPHPCDLLATSQAAEALGEPVAEVERAEPGDSDGGQASCAWIGAGGDAVLGLILEGPSFFAAAGPGYGSAGEAYAFWRDDAEGAGFAVDDLEGVGDAAFIPRIGEGPHNTLTARAGPYLLHVSLLVDGPGLEERMQRAARLAAAALAGP